MSSPDFETNMGWVGEAFELNLVACSQQKDLPLTQVSDQCIETEQLIRVGEVSHLTLIEQERLLERVEDVLDVFTGDHGISRL